jgi:hypothetical protein
MECDWKPLYDNVQEAIPLNSPGPQGKLDDTHLFLDADHAGDHITCKSQTGFFIFVNGASIVWYSK